MSISFQIDEEGLDHQFEMPDVPLPDALQTDEEIRQQRSKTGQRNFEDNFVGSTAIQVRPIDPVDMLHEPAPAGSTLLDALQ